jgi:poly-gamma-glutamate capsule biosynthesis protein CapA/YwtB (metallophosphatase superfamily)
MNVRVSRSVPRSSSRRAARAALALLVGVGAAAASVAHAEERPLRPAVRVAPPVRTLLVVAAGDILTENRVLEEAAAAASPGERYEFGPLFAPIVPIVASADLAICHMELPIGGPGARAGVYGRSAVGSNLLLAPYERARGVRDAGFDRCSTASNHAHDLGHDGIASTLEALDAAGLGHSGTARSVDEASVRTFEVNGGTRVAHLSYTKFANSPPLPEPWMNFAGNVAEVASAVRAARAAGAEIVILSLHIAKEMLSYPMGYDRDFVEELTAVAPLELIVMHGPHVVQPVEEVNGAVVFWSVGNLLSAMGVPGTGKYEDRRTLDGLLAAVRFTDDGRGGWATEVSPVAVCNERQARVVHAPVSELANETLPPGLRSELEECVARTAAVVPDLR